MTLDVRTTRREALVAAVAAPALLSPGTAAAAARDDAAILRELIDLEQRAILAYDEALRSGKLDSRSSRIAQTFRDQERKHADGLTQRLRYRGGRPDDTRKRPSEVRGLTAALARGQEGILEFLVGLEEATVGSYYDALGALRDARLRNTLVSIMPNEGQHLAVLREALGREPVPEAFERGRE